MKHVTLVIIFLSVHWLTDAQIAFKVVMKEKTQDYNIGDTIEVQGFRKSEGFGSDSYIIKNKDDIKYLSTSKAVFINRTGSFWDQLWFYNRSYDAFTNNGFDQKLRNQLFT